MPGFTANQQRAIKAEGNVLVMAGAGAGKTRTLVERCLDRMLAEHDRVSLDEVLLVTFTEAAALEMRLRIRARLEEECLRQPELTWLSEQLALVETARISTLHGVCYQIVREHFYDLELDPQVAVLEEAQAKMLAGEVLDRLLKTHYQGKGGAHDAVRELIVAHGNGSDLPIRDLVQQIHHYSQTLPDTGRWFSEHLESLRQPSPIGWTEWLLKALEPWQSEWIEALQPLAGTHPRTTRCLAKLMSFPRTPDRAQAAEALRQIVECEQITARAKLGSEGHLTDYEKEQRTRLLKKLFREAGFLLSVARLPGDGSPAPDPMQQDWEWACPHLLAVLEMAQEFAWEFGRAKRELGVADFHDLEQFALRLLWNPAANAPTSIARRWRARIKLVFVDEYQDINAAQDRIIQALSRTGDEANRFLVGDVKQSIYRFRLANPRIFRSYVHQWSRAGGEGQVIPLSDNFRSHESILNFINPLFAGLLREELSGVGYGEDARLVFGDPENRGHMTATAANGPPQSGGRVELLLHVADSEKTSGSEESDAAPTVEASAAEKEARIVAARLRELRQGGFLVWDEGLRSHRPVEWRDMVILLRAPRNKAEGFAKAFAQAGIPLLASRSGLYQATEVSDLLNLLILLDNPIQDLPLLAVLRSPLVGLTLNELAVIRIGLPKGDFWTALKQFQDCRTSAAATDEAIPIQQARASAMPKVNLLLQRYARWRELARQGSLAHCLESVLDETHYEDWLLAQPQGAQRRANVQRFLTMVREFDRLQRRGLFRFLKAIEAQQDAELEPEPAPVETQNAVRLLSVHRAKGLEFPVVVVADLDKPFHTDDQSSEVLLDEEYGVCSMIRPPDRRVAFPSLPLWLARRRQKRETTAEELRLLYVATTRACDKLILSGTARAGGLADRWGTAPANGSLSTPSILAARNCLDWIGPLATSMAGDPTWMERTRGESALFDWRIHTEADPPVPQNEPSPNDQATGEGVLEATPELLARLRWRYPFEAATLESAKTSVSALRHRAEELDEEARPYPWRRPAQAGTPPAAKPSLSATAIGAAHHRFLEFVQLEQTASLESLHAESLRLTQAGLLADEESRVLDLARLAAFWQSPLGVRIRDHGPHVQRELPFTARLSPADFLSLGLPLRPGLSPEEFVVIQGVADLVVILAKEIWLVDFKTDRLQPDDLGNAVTTYTPQLALYALCLSRIYQRPVTQAWLHFLSLDRSVSLALPPGSIAQDTEQPNRCISGRNERKSDLPDEPTAPFAS